MALVTISFTFSSLDVIFQPGPCLHACSSVVWVSASTHWCQLPVQKVPPTIPIPHSSTPASGE